MASFKPNRKVNAVKAFLSHSSKDKSLVIKVHEALEPRATWLDRAEIEWGDVFLEKITQGIQQASDFVLFWSAEAAASGWVRHELNMAFILMMREKALRLRIILLDKTPLPLHIQPFNYLDVSTSDDPLTLILENLKHDLEESLAAQRHRFLNRHNELGRIEAAIDDPDSFMILLSGFQGIGKRSLANEALTRFFSGSDHITLEITNGTDLVELAFKLNAYSRNAALKEELSQEDLVQELKLSIETIAKEGRLLLLVNVHYWLNETGQPIAPLTTIIDIVRTIPDYLDRPIIASSTRRVSMDVSQGSGITSINVGGLSSDNIASLIRLWHQITEGKSLSHEESKEIAKELHGHPISAKPASYLIGQFGVTYLRDHPHQLLNLRRDIARYLLTNIQLSERAELLLGSLAVIRSHIPATVLCTAMNLSDEDFHDAVKQASNIGVLLPDKVLQIHPMFQDYFWRLTWDRQDYKPIANSIAIAVLDYAQQHSIGSVEFADHLPVAIRLFALAGEFDKAREIRSDFKGELLDAAIEHYNRRQYDLAERYIDFVLDSDPNHFKATFYMSRILIRKEEWSKADEMLDRMLNERPYDYGVRHAQGWRYLRSKDHDKALSIFATIIAEHNHVASIRDSAECLYALNRNDDALKILQRAKNIESNNPFILDLESRILEEMGQFEEAFEAAKLAVLRDPRRWSFHHRLGRILVKQNKVQDSIEHFRRAKEFDPDQFIPSSSLVSALLDCGYAPTEVRKELNALNAVTRTPRDMEIFKNLESRCLKLEGKIEEAIVILENEIRGGRNIVPNSGILAEIRLIQYENERYSYPANASVYLQQAKEIIGKGLQIEPQNQILLSLQEKLS